MSGSPYVSFEIEGFLFRRFVASLPELEAVEERLREAADLFVGGDPSRVYAYRGWL